MPQAVRSPHGEHSAGLPETLARKASVPLAESVAIMARLRGPGGCPWDREQTFDTIKRYTLEETYEVFDAIERRAWPDLKDELGDLLLQVLFYAQMAADTGYFDIADVAANLNAKLIRRHPHVFPANETGELVEASDSKTVLRNWEQIKAEEKRNAKQEDPQRRGAKDAEVIVSGLDDIPRTMPAALEAHKLGSRAAKVGFDWPDPTGLLAKLGEEIAELRVEMQSNDHSGNKWRIEEEFGDLMFTAINLARHLKIDSESALRAANAKFRARFRSMEASAGGYDALGSRTPDELEALWAEAKQAE
jgi:XTP/dITP diphosphohydrolase/ATP diphosphatase